MADKKKVYSIVINGLKESVDLVDSLNNQLKDLEKNINAVKDKTIKIKGEVEVTNMPEQKVVVGGGSTGSSSAEKEKLSDKELAIQKQITAEKKAQAQLDAMQTEEYQKSYAAISNTKEAIKGQKKELEAAAAAERLGLDVSKEHANTIAAMKSELSDLKKVRELVDPNDAETMKNIQERALELETILKSIESEAGVYSRNVGNYPQLLKQSTQEWENIQKIIASLSEKLKNATPGTDEYDKLKSELELAEKYAKTLDDRLGEIKSNLNEVNQTGIKIDVGGKEREFNSLKEAVRTLTKELQQMALAGETDTKEFEATMTAVGKLKTAISQTNEEMQSYVGNSKALSDTIEILQGISGIMSIGAGISTLFGGQNEELDEMIRKFAGLTMVMQGLDAEYKAIQNNQSIFGESLKTVWEWLDKLGNIKLFGKWGPSINGVIDGLKKAGKYTQELYDKTKAVVDIRNAKSNVINEDYQKVVTQTMKFKADDESLKEIQGKVLTALANIQTFKIALKLENKGKDEALAEIEKLRDQYLETIQSLKDTKIDLEVNDASEEEIEHIDQLINNTKESLTALDNTQLYINTGDTTEIMSQIDSTIEGLTDKITEMKKAGKDTSELEKMVKTLENFKTQAQLATTQATGLTGKLVAMGSVGKGVAAAINFVTLSVKALTVAFKALGKATIILALLQVAMELIQPVIEAISGAISGLIGWVGKGINVFKSFFGVVGATAGQTQASVDAMNTSLEQAEDRLSKFNKQVDRLQKAGALSNVDAGALKLQKLGLTASQSGLELQKFITTVDNLDKALKDNLGAIGTWYESGEKNVDDFIKRWDTLRKAVEAGTDEVEQGGSGWGWWYTASDAVDDFTDANKAMLQDLSNQIQKIDFSKPETAVKEFDKLFQGEIGNARDYAYRNIDKLFPEEPWAQMLKARLDATKNFLEQYRDMMAETGDLTAQLHKDAAKQIRDNMAAALPEAQRERAQLKNQREDEIENMKKQGYALEDERKLEASINAKYDRMESDRRKARLKSTSKSGEDEYNILKQIRDNLLTLQAEGLEKEKQKLKNAMDDELNSAKKAGKLRGELEESIRKKYQKKIEDLEKEWYKNQLKQREAFNKEMIKMAQEAADELLEIQNAAAMNNINRGLDQAENTNVKRTATISYDTTIDTSTMSFEDNDKNLENQKKYYQEMLKAQSEYIAEKTKLQLEESLTNEEQLKQQAEREYRQRLESNKEWQEKQLEELNKAAQDGLVTEEEYHERLDQLTQTYQNANADTYEAYQTKLSEIAKNGEQERDNIVSEGRQEQQRINAEANQNGIDAIQEYYNEIADIADREQKKNMNRHTGLFNYSAEKERLEKVKAEYEKVMSDLDAEYEKLKQQLNDNEIDFSQFQAGKKQIEDLKKQAEDAAEDTGESLSGLFEDWSDRLYAFAQKIASQFNEMFSTFQNIQSLMLDAEQNQLDKEQEILDKQKDAVDKAYEKQAEIVERYRDKINDTEDELKNARGERREALIDSLAQQREAYLAETATLKQQEVEKEKIAQKEEQLKKKQDALEKKRKKQQQAASVVNAIINTALGVTQALASWPPPASYALAAAVGALGAVEIALISSQKYAKGGLLEGDSHKNGGITLGYNRKGIRQEAEGGEYIVNKRTTTENLSLIEFVNSRKRRLSLDDFIEFYSGKAKGTKRSPLNYYAEGGELPELTNYSEIIQNQPVQVELTLDSKVSVVDIINSMDRVNQTKVLAGL